MEIYEIALDNHAVVEILRQHLNRIGLLIQQSDQDPQRPGVGAHEDVETGTLASGQIREVGKKDCAALGDRQVAFATAMRRKPKVAARIRANRLPTRELIATQMTLSNPRLDEFGPKIDVTWVVDEFEGLNAALQM
jgi:hypothetical protein